MFNSNPIPIVESGQNNPNAYYNQAFSRSELDLANSPQSPPYYLDPRSPREVFSVPTPLQSPAPSTDSRNRNTNFWMQENDLHKSIIDEVRGNVLDGIGDNVWGFLSYMEHGHRVASTYIGGKEFIVDNSSNPIDKTRLGLAGLPFPAGSSNAEVIRHAIHKGIILTSDEFGNVYLINETEVPVIINGFDDPEHYCISEDVILLKGNIVPGDTVVKVFDIEEFRCQIGLQMVKNCDNKEELRNMSIIRICFRDAEPRPNPPCWLLLVNLTALKMIDSEEDRAEIQEYIASLKVTKGKRIGTKEREKEIRGRPEARRKVRIELRKQGECIKNHMKYSWDDVYNKIDAPALNMEIVKQQFEEPEANPNNSDDEDNAEAEAKLELGLQRLKTVVRKNDAPSLNTEVLEEQPEEPGADYCHSDDEDIPEAEAKMELAMQRLNTVVESDHPTPSASPIQNVRPVKRWAKLNYIVQQRTDKGAY